MADRDRDRYGEYDRGRRYERHWHYGEQRPGEQQRRYSNPPSGEVDYERSRYGRARSDWGTGDEPSRSHYDRDYSSRDREGGLRGSRRDWSSRSGYGRDFGRRTEDIDDYDIDRGYPTRRGRDYETFDYGRRGRVEESYGFRPEDYDEERDYEGSLRYDARSNEEGRRGWWDRASDEVASWFGDDEARRRRRMDYIRRGEYRGKGPKGYKRSDNRIEEDINDRLTDHPYIDASEIEVGVTNGEVVLSGSVDDRSSKRLAEDITEEVSGVHNVENRLRVRGRDYDRQVTKPESEPLPASKSATTQRT